MKVKELREALQQLGRSHTSAAEIRELESLLAPLDEIGLADLCKAISTAIAKRAKTEERRLKKLTTAKGVVAIDELHVARYVSELAETSTDNAAFEAVVKRIEKDRTIKIGEAREIASRYTGKASNHKTKKDAMKAVLERQITNRRSAARASQVSDLF